MFRRPVRARDSAARVVAVTGAAGLIGTACLQALDQRGERVIAIDRRRGAAPGSWRLADLRDPRSARKALDGATHVIHLAGHTSPDAAAGADVLMDNVGIATNVLQSFAGDRAQTAVLASSVAVYGFVWSDAVMSPEYLPVDEEHPARPSDPYSRSKLVIERLSAEFTRSTGITTVNLRVCWTSGDEPHRVTSYIGALEAQPRSELGRRHLWASVHVADVADAFVRSLDVSDGEPHVLNIASFQVPRGESVRDLVGWGHPTAEQRGGSLDQCAFGIDRAGELLGWFPTHSFATGTISGETRR